MKVDITFENVGVVPRAKFISMIKFYRDVTGEGLRDSKNAIEAMLASGKFSFTAETHRTVKHLKEIARLSSVEISVENGSMVIGTIELMQNGQVRFDISMKDGVSLKTMVGRKSAGRVLNEFLQSFKSSKSSKYLTKQSMRRAKNGKLIPA